MLVYIGGEIGGRLSPDATGTAVDEDLFLDDIWIGAAVGPAVVIIIAFLRISASHAELSDLVSVINTYKRTSAEKSKLKQCRVRRAKTTVGRSK